jgi:hypothetical protein
MNEELYILFENYLNNDLSESEKKDFENQLQNDSDIQEKFEIYKELNGYLETKFSSESVDFKKNLETISKENFTLNKVSKSKVISFKPWQYAIAAMLILSFGMLILNQNGSPEFNDYNQHENAYFTERGNVIKNLKQAQEAFNAKNYKEAIINFELVLKSYNRPEVEFFYAVSLLEENRLEECEIIFNKIKLGKSIYKDKATWYLALSSLKQKKYEDCKNYIKQLPIDAEDYDKAKKLLKELD